MRSVSSAELEEVCQVSRDWIQNKHGDTQSAHQAEAPLVKRDSTSSGTAPSISKVPSLEPDAPSSALSGSSSVKSFPASHSDESTAGSSARLAASVRSQPLDILPEDAEFGAFIDERDPVPIIYHFSMPRDGRDGKQQEQKQAGEDKP